MEKVNLNFTIVDRNLIPIIEQFLSYKYDGCILNIQSDQQFVLGKNKYELTQAVNDIRKLAMLAVGCPDK